MDLEEFWIDYLKSPYIGDDGAIIGDLVLAMDSFFEGTHFKKEWMSAKEIAKKAFLVNYSDLVAMNAKPHYMLLAISFPKETSKEYLRELGNTFKELAKHYDIKIIGGDTIGSTLLTITITMIGKSENPLKRVVKEGDLLAFTGDLGSVKRDLEKLFNGEKVEKNSKFFEPIIREKFVFTAAPYLRGGMDISDGLYCDCNKLLQENGLFLQELKVIPPEIGFSGEEYEMLIAIEPKNLKKVQSIAKLTNTPLTIFAKAASRGEYYPCKSHHF